MINAAALILSATIPFHGVFVELEHQEQISKTTARDIIIANIVGYAAGSSTPDPKFDDAETLLRNAPPSARIYVGLVYQEDFDVSEASASQLDAARKEEVAVANQFLTYLREKKITRPLAGWYLAREIHNVADPLKQQLVRNYLARLSEELPPLGSILIAPYFATKCKNSNTLDAASTGAFFASLVNDTRITHLLLQDGFSARFDHHCSWPKWEKYVNAAEVYEREVSKAVRNVNVAFWVDMEVFHHEKEAVTLPRILKQLEVLPPRTPVVAYHYEDCRDLKLNAAVCPEK